MHSIEEARERAALYNAGALPDEEQREFETHLTSGCATCRAEHDAFRTVPAALGTTSRRCEPRAALREVVLAAVDRAATENAIIESDGIRFVHSQRLSWESVADGALRVKRLAHDPERRQHSLLIRLEPGQTYPAHRHAGVEEVFLVEGQMTLNGVTMHAGDYCRAAPGSVHGTISTVHGCTFVAIASELDEILA